MKEKVVSYLKWSRIFYFSYVFIAYICLIALENPFIQAIRNFKYEEIAFFQAFMILSMYLYFKCGSDPGYAPFEPRKNVFRGSSFINEKNYDEVN